MVSAILERITLVSDTNSLLFTPMLAEVAGGVSEARSKEGFSLRERNHTTRSSGSTELFGHAVYSVATMELKLMPM